MARREPRFQVTVDHRISSCHHCFSQTGFLLQIRNFFEDDNGNVQENYREGEFQEETFMPEFVFGSNRHRNHVAHRLHEAGWRDQDGLERILDAAFSEAKLILEKEKETKQKNINSGKFRVIPIIILRVKKFVRREDELEAMALELSMQETPKPVPATKGSIQTLQKVKLELEGDGDDDGMECMICMVQLMSSGTEVTRMPCSHLFHGDCIQKWLNTCHQCPLCRFPMPTDANPNGEN
ncbi:hypothetical protein CRYUN_Cryun07bG0075400 [Craigia yunnanensis]